jgi:hypothetical protein
MTLPASGRAASVGRHHIDGMVTLDLTDDEVIALIEHLKHALDADPYPLAPRLTPLKAILAKLEPSPPKPDPLPPLRPGPTHGQGRRRR